MHWVSCSDALPEMHEWVLTWRNKTPLSSFNGPSMAKRTPTPRGDGGWAWTTHIRKLPQSAIAHWMRIVPPEDNDEPTQSA